MGFRFSFQISKPQGRNLKINSTLIVGIIFSSFIQYLALKPDNPFLTAQIFGDCKKVNLDNSWRLLSEEDQKWPGELRFIAVDARGTRAQFLLPQTPWKPVFVGDEIRARGKVYGVCSNGKLPWIRSYRGYLFRKGVSAYVRAKSFQVLSRQVSQKSFKVKLVEKALERFGAENEALAVVLAATLGEKSLLGIELEELFRRLGISHLLVVSGFHVGVVFAMVFFLANKFLAKVSYLPHLLPIKNAAKLLALLICALYVNFVGFKLTTLRAILMLAVAVLASYNKTELVNLRGLLVCALVCLLVWPGCFLDLSFQLVFSALFGIYTAIWILARLQLRRFWNAIIGAILVSFFAWLSTAPVLYIQLNYFNPLQPLINAIISPVFSFLCIALGVLGLFVLAIFGWDGILRASVFFCEKLLWFLQAI